MSESELLATILGAGIIIAIFCILILIAWLVFYYVGLWKMYVKAGRPGWKAIIPLYNDYVLCEIVGLKWYWFLLMILSSLVSLLDLEGPLVSLVSIASLIASINVYYNLAKKFNKDTTWFILTIFFGAITIPILGYSKNDTFTDVPTSENGFFGGSSNGSTNVSGNTQSTNTTATAQDTSTPVESTTSVEQNVTPVENNHTDSASNGQ